MWQARPGMRASYPIPVRHPVPLWCPASAGRLPSEVPSPVPRCHTTTPFASIRLGLRLVKCIEVQSISRDIHDDHVFLYRGKPLKSIRDSLRRTCQKIGIPYGRNVKNGITPHDLRHTFNTYMRKSGAHDTVTMDITGHATRKMFDWYNTVDDSEKAEAVKQLEDFVLGQNQKKQ